jgi:hypothetical protein
VKDDRFDPNDPRFRFTTAGGWARMEQARNVQSETAPLQQNQPRDGASGAIPATLPPDKSPQPNPKEAQEFLQQLGGDDHVLCCIHPDRPGLGRSGAPTP